MIRFVTISVAVISALLPTALRGSVINVPGDVQTIQEGIDSAADGDTILVAPGFYAGGNFNGKGITVASLALTTGDDAYIDSTYLYPSAGDSIVVSIPSCEEANSLLYGFILYGGSNSHGYGGGLVIADSGSVGEKLLIEVNEAGSGGGVYLTGTGPKLTDVRVINNQCHNTGGGIYITGSNAVLERVTVADNSAVYGGGISNSTDNATRIIGAWITGNYVTNNGGGIASLGGGIIGDSLEIRDNHADGSGGACYLTADDPHYFSHSVITGDSAGAAGALYIRRGEVTLSNVTLVANLTNSGGAIVGDMNGSLISRNTIYWDNGGLLGGGYGTVDFAYCDVQGGQDVLRGLNVNQSIWGDGNIDADPGFINADENDWNLAEGSPCIDAGDPTTHDPDGTVADIGACYFIQAPGCLHGFVFNHSDSTALPGASVTTTLGQNTTSDAEGYWHISPAYLGRFSLTVSAAGHNDSVFAGLQMEIGDTLQLDAALYHPEIALSIEDVQRHVNPGDTAQAEFSLFNRGDGPLQWRTDRRLPGEQRQPWDYTSSYPVSDRAQNPLMQGVACADGMLFVSGSGDTCYIYVFNSDGDYIRRFAHQGNGNLGDLAYDGELIWGVGGSTAYGYTTDGELTMQWSDQSLRSSAIAWDGDRRAFWTAIYTDGHIVGLDEAQNLVGELDAPQYITGLAYWPDDPDGMPLYLFRNSNVNGTKRLVYKINPENDSLRFVTQLDDPVSGQPGGCEITSDLHVSEWNFIALVNDGRDDRVDVYSLGANVSWMLLDPAAGTLAGGGEQMLTLALDVARPDTMRYQGNIVFIHNAAGGELILPVIFDVGQSAPPGDATPHEFGLPAVYPNPFNQSTVVSYQLSVTSPVSLYLYDISGRLITNQELGIGNPGQHRAAIDGSRLVSGVYLLKLAAGREAAVRKVVCVR